MATANPVASDTAIQFERVEDIDAPIETAFQAVLDQLGPHTETPGGDAMPMVLEAWPGGRWYRDLGDGEGHLWGFVQAIKRPTLVELYGPTFMSYAALSNIQYRLEEKGTGTVLTMRYSAMGLFEREHIEGLTAGWESFLALMKKRAEKLARAV